MNTNLLDSYFFRNLGSAFYHVRNKARLLKTGQTTQYGGYLDDGFYRIGENHNYQILTTGQYSGVTNITLNGKTDAHSNNVVIDWATGLMWSRYVSASVGSASDGKIPWTTNINGEGIFPYATAANAANLGGYNDWRIPNEMELLSLRKMEAPSAIPDTTAFPGFPSVSGNAAVWTSTTLASNATLGVDVNFFSGITVSATKTTIQVFCLLVRGLL